MNNKMKQQKGFTLIELIFVIVILGILAAAALPRFVDLTTDARQSALEGMSGSIRSAVAMSHADAIVKEQTGPTGAITVEGQTIALVNGYPNSASVMNLIGDSTGYAEVAGTGTVAINNGAATVADCRIVYTDAVAGNPPAIVLSATDCS